MTAGDDTPVASIVIPTRGRPAYLDVALATVVPQAAAAGAEVLVVNDGADPATDAASARHGSVRVVSLQSPRGVNGARNAGIRAARADLIVLLDDDVQVPPGWLDAMLDGARAGTGYDVLGGPIRGRLEGPPIRSCGREPPPVSTYDFGADDRDVPYIFGGNTAFRRSAFERLGHFDESLSGSGDEEEWMRRYTASGGRIRYLAAAGLDHRRAPADATLAALARAAYRRGREARRHDARVDRSRSIGADARILAGCAWHTVRRRCAYGIVMGARALGSLHEGLIERARSIPGRPRVMQ
ncbi:MAG: glycosyltransferase family 2 protein [Solirubrobacteraceae bacterium]